MPYNPWHFYAGTKARLNAGLKSQVYGDANLTEYKVGTDDPTVTAQNMSKGSIYIDTTNMRAWQKMDNGSTTNFRTLRADEWTKEATGFPDPDNTVVTYDTTNRTVTLSHASGTVTFLIRGRKFAYASPWTVPTVLGGATPIAHNVANGSYFLKIDPDTLAVSFGTAPWTFSDLMICFAYKSATAQFALREPHGLLPYQAHEELHSTQGTYIKSATVSADYVPVGGVGYSTSDSNQNRPSIAQQTVYDEDIPTVVPAWPDNGPYTLLYAGATTPVFLTGELDIFPLSGAVAAYDNNGVLTAVAEDAYFNVLTMHLPVTADAASQVFRTIFVIGQTTYTTQAAAQAAVPASWNLSGLGGQITEYVSSLLWTFQENSGGTGSVTKRGTARLMADPTRFVGTRSSQIAASGISPTDHQALSNRSAADAHPDTSITATGSYTGTLAGVTTVGGALTILDGLKTLLTTGAVRASGSGGLQLQNSSGNDVLLIGPGGGLSATFYDGVNITGVLDQASAATMQIGINNATAITIGKAGITTTNAGAFTSSQLLTASLGVTLGGGTAANGKIWYGSSAIQFGNNVGNVTDAGSWTLGSATTTTTTHTFQCLVNSDVGGYGFRMRNYTTTAGKSLGLITIAGTNSSDSCQVWLAADNTTLLGKCDGAGAWTWGPTSGSSLQHYARSGQTTTLYVQSGNTYGAWLSLSEQTSAITWTFAKEDSANTNSWVGGARGLNFNYYDGTTKNFGGITSAGAWTFPVATTHTFGGGSDAAAYITLKGRSTATAGAFRLYRQNTPHWQIGLDDGGPGSTNGFYIYNDVNSVYAAGCSPTGAWTLGPASGAALLHKVQAGDNVTLELRGGGTNKDARIDFVSNGSGMKTIYANNGAAAGGLYVRDYDNTDGVLLALNATSWASASDARLKRDIIDIDNCLQKSLSIIPKYYNYKTDDTSVPRRVGVIAQDVLRVLPEAVSTDNPDELQVRYTELIPLLFGSIQELSAKLDAEKARNDALEARLAQAA